METSNIHSITLTLSKLSGSRTWWRRFKAPAWTPKLLTLTPTAAVRYAHPTDPNSTSSFTLIPGGASHAPHSEQLLHARHHLFSLLVVADIPDDRPRRRVLLFAAQSAADASRAVSYAIDVSFRRMGGLFAPFVGPLLSAWGARRRLPPLGAVAAAAALGHDISSAGFAHAFQSAVGATISSYVSSEEFVAVMMHAAADTLTRLLSLPQAPSTLDARQLAPVLGVSESVVHAELRSAAVDRCSSSLLVFLLFRPANSALNPELAADPHDMSHPLSHYLISSSHNTYLTGDQFRSDSSAHMYRIALEQRCRCLELDLWDGDDGRPVVTHGHTMTSEETLEHVLHVIVDHAFDHGSDLPLILSLENHLSLPQQTIAADMFRDVLAETLLVAEDGHDLPQLPSPDELRGRILLKAKTGGSVLRRDAGKTPEAQMLVDVVEDDDSSDYDSSSHSSVDGEPARVDGATCRPKKTTKKKKHKAVAPELSQLVFLAGGNRKTLAALWKSGVSGADDFVSASCVSLDEKKLASAYEHADPEVIREYNCHALTRVYPKGLRMDSSNFTPTLAHYLGCQLVALNWQHQDSALAVNDARFEANDGQGYVLARSVREPSSSGVLQLTVLAAFLLPQTKNRVKSDLGDPYCVVKLYDSNFNEEDDYSSFKYETEPVRNNSFIPVWNQTMSIPVQNQALAVVSLKVYDRDRSSGDDLLGYCAVATSMIREGLRCFPLKSKKGDPLTLPGTELRPSVLARIKWA